MQQAVEQALRGDVAAMTLSGSSPSRATHELYSELIALAQARRVPVFLDTYGPALDAIWGFWPTAMQLNRREAAAHLRKPTLSDDDAAELLQRVAAARRRLGRDHRRASTGRDPVPGAAIPGPAPGRSRPSTRSARATRCWPARWTAGSERMEPEPMIRHAMGCAVANAMTWDAGAIDPAEVAGGPSRSRSSRWRCRQDEDGLNRQPSGRSG